MTRTIHSPPWTLEDRALVAALDAHKATLCPGCGHPRAEAWHADMEGWYDAVEVVCHACTARAGGTQQAFGYVANTRDMQARPLPPYAFGVTTTAPDKPTPEQ